LAVSAPEHPARLQRQREGSFTGRSPRPRQYRARNRRLSCRAAASHSFTQGAVAFGIRAESVRENGVGHRRGVGARATSHLQRRESVAVRRGRVGAGSEQKHRELVQLAVDRSGVGRQGREAVQRAPPEARLVARVHRHAAA
jgi:hypothetical protein